jgi:acetyltransferase-like isoleucine patch superfamily enzyme
MDSFILKIRRGETPFYRRLRAIARVILQPSGPPVPNFLKPPLRIGYEVHFWVIRTVRTSITLCYRHPLFQARCARTGRGLMLEDLPFITGQPVIEIGNNVYIGGQVSIASGRFIDKPRLIIKDRAAINWRTMITVNREVIIEEDARISYDCRISDSDGHPRQADLRLMNAPLDPRDIRPVRIGRNAWIGNGAHIMKGVTIGEGAIVGANSVVISDVPPFALALGNPAEIYFKNFGKPSKKSRAAERETT